MSKDIEYLWCFVSPHGFLSALPAGGFPGEAYGVRRTDERRMWVCNGVASVCRGHTATGSDGAASRSALVTWARPSNMPARHSAQKHYEYFLQYIKFARMQDYSAQLSKYMPASAAPIISRWINDSHCIFRISRSRTTKFGDYRAPYNGQGHRISVNHNLNPYAFLITTVHEFAHLLTWNMHKDRVKPHGREWKVNFGKLMEPFIQSKIFPEDIQLAIIRYMGNPAASSCTDLQLFRVLKRYDAPAEHIHTIELLPHGTFFTLKNGRIFQKKEKIRKRYRCVEVETKRIYLFNPLAEVIPLQSSN